MKKLLWVGPLFAICLAAPAMAADMAVKAPAYKAPVAATIYNWTGWFVGGNAGYGGETRTIRWPLRIPG